MLTCNREELATVFDVVQCVDIGDNSDHRNEKLLLRRDLGLTFTKLYCWRLKEFTKCVFMDADTMVGYKSFTYIIVVAV